MWTTYWSNCPPEVKNPLQKTLWDVYLGASKLQWVLFRVVNGHLHRRRGYNVSIPKTHNVFCHSKACTLPLITTTAGGSDGLMGNKGVVVHLDDPTALRNAIEGFHTEPDRFAKPGQAPEMKGSSMGWQTVAGRCHMLYREVVQCYNGR